MATTFPEPDIPAKCCTAPLIPTAMYSFGQTVMPVMPT